MVIALWRSLERGGVSCDHFARLGRPVTTGLYWSHEHATGAKPSAIDRLREFLERDPRIGYAVIFGSAATGRASIHSDVDLAIGVSEGCRLDTLDLGALTSEIEAVAGAPVDLVLLEEAPPGLAYRVFRDGQTIAARDPAALARRRARAILEYLDFQPIEALFARGVLSARHSR